MAKAPSVNEINNFDNSEVIELENNQSQKFKLTISNNSKLIQFTVEDLISFPKNEYIYIATLEELQKINKYFLVFQNTQEVYQALIKSSKQNSLRVILENDKCGVKIKNPINDEELTINLTKKEKDIKEEFMSLIPLVLELKKKWKS